MPGQNISILSLAVVAAGTIIANRFVGFDGNQAATQGQKVFGPSEFAGVAGDAITCTVKGTAVVETGAALNPGDTVITDNVGRAIPTTGALKIAAGAVAVTSVAANGATDLAGSDLPEFICGRVLPGQSASAAGGFVEILLP